MVSYSKNWYSEHLGLQLAGHFLRVLCLPACLVYPFELQAQVLDLKFAFEGGFHALPNMISVFSMGVALWGREKSKRVTRVLV
jgi:hypothetical protein